MLRGNVRIPTPYYIFLKLLFIALCIIYLLSQRSWGFVIQFTNYLVKDFTIVVHVFGDSSRTLALITEGGVTIYGYVKFFFRY